MGSSASSIPDSARRCGITAVDELWGNGSSAPIRPVDDPAAIGAVQELLAGHGSPGLPGPLSLSYGLFGPITTAALARFQSAHSLAVQPLVNRETLQRLISEPASVPLAGRAYLGLALGFAPSQLLKALSLVSQMEGMGRFAALNLNTDGAGLSFGLIQWAQRPGRLAEILTASEAADPAQFTAIFGAGDAAVAGGLLTHVRQPNGGVDSAGGSTDPAFNLTSAPWTSRFQQAALSPVFQSAQIQTALAAFTRSLVRIRSDVPEVRTERGIAFLLDVANQFGDAGVSHLCDAARRPGSGESDLLHSIADVSVAKMPAAFKDGVRARRNAFLTTRWLSEAPFE